MYSALPRPNSSHSKIPPPTPFGSGRVLQQVAPNSNAMMPPPSKAATASYRAGKPGPSMQSSNPLEWVVTNRLADAPQRASLAERAGQFEKSKMPPPSRTLGGAGSIGMGKTPSTSKSIGGGRPGSRPASSLGFQLPTATPTPGSRPTSAQSMQEDGFYDGEPRESSFERFKTPRMKGGMALRFLC
jgi:hypothetical protein